MSEKSVAVVDTNVLLNLATPVVDTRPQAPSGEDPLKTLLVTYNIHTPRSVIGELTEITGQDDFLAAAADIVLKASHALTTHDVADQVDDTLDYGLDRGESEGIWLANELEAELFITDEFNSTNYLFVNLALNDRNTLFTTPHILCTLANHDILSKDYVEAALSYLVEIKGWDAEYVAFLRHTHLNENDDSEAPPDP